jgi:hypothetical protein
MAVIDIYHIYYIRRVVINNLSLAYLSLALGGFPDELITVFASANGHRVLAKFSSLLLTIDTCSGRSLHKNEDTARISRVEPKEKCRC